MNGFIKVFAGRAGKSLVGEICTFLSIDPGQAIVEPFSDGEVRVQLLDNVRDSDVFIVNPTQPPAENFLDMAFLAKAAVGSSAKRVTLVIPYLGYNRQDRKDRPRVPISAKFIADMLKATGANRVLLLDLHSEATMGFFEPMVIDHLYGSIVMLDYLRSLLHDNVVVASPDKGGGPRALAYCRRLGKADYVLFNKDREQPNEVNGETVKIIGLVEGKDVLFVDDMIDTGGTLIADATAAKKAGANKIYACATHGIFSGEALEKLAKSEIDEIVVTNSIPQPDLTHITKPTIKVMSVAPLIAKAIRCLNSGDSLSKLIS